MSLDEIKSVFSFIFHFWLLTLSKKLAFARKMLVLPESGGTAGPSPNDSHRRTPVIRNHALKSNGHVTDDVTRPCRPCDVIVMT